MNYIFVRRIADGKVMDVPERDLQETLKRGFEVVESPVQREVSVPEVAKIECPICGFIAKTDRGLKIHKASHE